MSDRIHSRRGRRMRVTLPAMSALFREGERVAGDLIGAGGLSLRVMASHIFLDLWRLQRTAGLPGRWSRRVARAAGAAGWRTVGRERT